MLNFKVVTDEDIYITQSKAYGPIGKSLQTSLDQFIDSLLTLITNGSIEGDIATTLNEYGNKLREKLSQDLDNIMTNRGGSSYNFQYDITQADVFSYESASLPATPPQAFPYPLGTAPIGKGLPGNPTGNLLKNPYGNPLSSPFGNSF